MTTEQDSKDLPDIEVGEDHVLAHNVDEEPVEANRRLFEGGLLKFVALLAIAYSAFHLYSLNIAPLETWSFRIVHIAGALVLGFVLFAGARFVSSEEGGARHRLSMCCIRHFRSGRWFRTAPCGFRSNWRCGTLAGRCWRRPVLALS